MASLHQKLHPLWAPLFSWARYRPFLNVDTNWEFAAGGPLGLLHQPWRGALIDYYALSVFLIVVHAALGLRIVLLGHGTKESTANRVVYAGTVVGALVTALIMAAALGLHLGS